MGLAGRKQKQRIPADPRNLSWADDASRFGHSYLAKFGWDASKGLGPSGDGMKTHLKVEQKLDMMGIGAQHQRDPNGIAWKQNKDFEALLRKLNEGVEQKNGADAEGEGRRERETTMVDEAFVHTQEEHECVEGEVENGSFVTTKKRKHKGRDDPDTSEHTGKKQKKRPKSGLDDSAASAIDSSSEPPSAPHPDSIPRPRPMAHRARVRAAKRIAGKPASAISEILGIAPSSSVSTVTSTSIPALTPPSTSTPASAPSLSLDNLTTSTKSVADYFKEKLLARSSSPASSPSSSAPSGSATPGLGATRLDPGLSNPPTPDDDGEPPRRGIGSQTPAVSADGQDVLTEKQRRKAERKAEKRKRRVAEATQATPEGVPTDVKGNMEEGSVENLERTSNKRKKKQKKAREQERQIPTDRPNDDMITKKGHENDVADSLPEPTKRSKKVHRKKCS